MLTFGLPSGTHRRPRRLTYVMGSEPRKSLPELMAFFGAPDETAPINRHVFARKVGELIARARAHIEDRKAKRRKRRDKQSK